MNSFVVHVKETLKSQICKPPSAFGPEHARETLKAKVRALLFEAIMASGTSTGLEHADPFPAVRAMVQFAKHEIVLIPYTTFISIVNTKDAPEDGPVIKLCEELSAVLKPRSSQPTDNSADYVMVPYWNVSSTPDSAESNMETATLKTIATFTTAGVDRKFGFQIPYLTNTRKLGPGSPLLCFRPSTEAVKRRRCAPAGGPAHHENT